MALASAGSLGPVLVYLLGAPRAPHADPGPGWVLSSVSPGGGADAGEVVLAADSTRESRDFLGTIVAEIQVYTVPMPDDSFLAGRATEKVPLDASVVSTVHVGPPFLTVDRTEPFSAISSAFLPGMGLSSGMGIV